MELQTFLLENTESKIDSPPSKTVKIIENKSGDARISTKVSIPFSWFKNLELNAGDNIFICKMINQIILCKSLDSISFNQKKEDMLKWVNKIIEKNGYIVFHSRIRDSDIFQDSYLELYSLAETYFHFEEGLTIGNINEIKRLVDEILEILNDAKRYDCIKNKFLKEEFEIQIYSFKNHFTKKEIEEVTNRGRTKEYILNNIEKEIFKFDEKINLNSKDSELYYKRGLSKMQLSDFKEAIEDFNKAIELKLEFGEAYHNRAICYWNVKRYTEGMEDIDKALEINPKSDWSRTVKNGFIKDLIGIAEDKDSIK